MNRTTAPGRFRAYIGAGTAAARSDGAGSGSGRTVSLLLLPLLALAGCAAPTAVKQEPTAEARLETRVKVALVDDPALHAAAIFVEADGKRIRLGGFADSEAQRTHAGEVARGITGVTGVENRIRIR